MSQNLQNFVKFQKFLLENLVDFEKCCTYFLAKIGADTAENEQNFAEILPKFWLPFVRPVIGPLRRRRRLGALLALLLLILLLALLLLLLLGLDL